MTTLYVVNLNLCMTPYRNGTKVNGINQAGCTALRYEFACLVCGSVSSRLDYRYLVVHGIKHSKQLGDERSAVRDSCFSSALDISFVKLKINHSVLLRNLVAVSLGRALGSTRDDKHRPRYDTAGHRGAGIGFFQLFTQSFDFFLDHLFERVLLVAVVSRKKNQGRNTTQV